MRFSMKHAVYEGRDYCRIFKKKPANANFSAISRPSYPACITKKAF